MNKNHYEEMTVDELREFITTKTTSKAEVDDQVKFAKRNARATGEFSDPDWLCRAETASRMIGRDIRVAMDELGRRLKEEKARRSMAYERQFVSAAKALLPPETYAAISAAASAQSEVTA